MLNLMNRLGLGCNKCLFKGRFNDFQSPCIVCTRKDLKYVQGDSYKSWRSKYIRKLKKAGVLK